MTQYEYRRLTQKHNTTVDHKDIPFKQITENACNYLLNANSLQRFQKFRYFAEITQGNKKQTNC